MERGQYRRMVAFAADRLAEDLDTAKAAGHGVELSVAERSGPLTVGWTRLQEEGNVRLSYDVRFLNRFSPRTVRADIERKCRLLERGDEHDVQVLIQEWADHHRFHPAWRLDPLPGRLLDRLNALRAEAEA